MKKIIIYIIINTLVLILIVLFFEQGRIENNKENSLSMNPILRSYKMELLLHRDIIGFKYAYFDSLFVNYSNSKTVGKYKLICLRFNSEDDEFGSEKTIIKVLDYYTELKSSLKYFNNTEIYLIQKTHFQTLEIYIHNNYLDEVSILMDNTNYFAQDFNFPERGAVVMLLNSNNVCQYAYYLEKSNERKVFENSTVINNILKNSYE